MARWLAQMIATTDASWIIFWGSSVIIASPRIKQCRFESGMPRLENCTFDANRVELHGDRSPSAHRVFSMAVQLNIVSHFSEVARARPDHAALITAGRDRSGKRSYDRLTFAELDRETD